MLCYVRNNTWLWNKIRGVGPFTSSNLGLQTSLSSPQNGSPNRRQSGAKYRSPAAAGVSLLAGNGPPMSSTPWQPLKSGPNRSHQFDSLSAVCVLDDVRVSVSSVGRSLVISIKVKSFFKASCECSTFLFLFTFKLYFSLYHFIHMTQQTCNRTFHVSYFGACGNQIQRSRF